MKVQTRERIISAAMNELARNPAASMEQIAEAASVSRITVFRYFSTRQQLMYALNVEINRIFHEIMEPLLQEDASAAHKLRKLVEVMVPYGATFRFLLFEPYRTGDPRLDRLLEDYLEHLRKLMVALEAEGLLDGQSSSWWAARHLDVLLWAAWDAIDLGELGPKVAPDLIIKTFYNGVGKVGVPR